MIDKVVGDYRIVRKIGEGGMGSVYVGVDTMLDREVAIKALRPALASQPEIIERFLSEAKTLARLNHPNVATLYSFLRHEGEYFMVLEFVRGQTFQAILAQRGAMACEEAVRLFCQVLDGIAHAHRLGIIHRDIKPSNLMLTEEGTLKVLDFGIARILGTERLTKAGQLAGTIEYMAPEQVLGREIDERTDIYSLGMLLYQMLTGRAPFAIVNEYELMKAQIELMPQPPRELNPSIPEEVERAVMRAVAKNPAERFQTAAEFRTALLGASFHQGAAATGAQSAVDHAAPTSFVTRPSNPSFDTSRLQEAQAATVVMGEEARDGDEAAPSSPDTASRRASQTRLAPHRVAAGAQTAASMETRVSTAAPVAPTAAAGQTASSAPDHAAPQAAAPVPPKGKLSWPYYAAAAAVLVVLISGLLVATSRSLFAGEETPPAAEQQPPVASQPAEPAQPQPDAAPTEPAAASVPQADEGQPGAQSVVESEPTAETEAPVPAQEVAAEPKPAEAEKEETAAPAERAGDAATKGQPKAVQGAQQRDRARAKKDDKGAAMSRDMKRALTGVP